MSEDDALRAIHLAENESSANAPSERLTFDEAVGLQWALVARRHGELERIRPARAARSDDGLRRRTCWSGCRSS